jgi:hypothetical protein
LGLYCIGGGYLDMYYIPFTHNKAKVSGMVLMVSFPLPEAIGRKYGTGTDSSSALQIL